MALEDLPGEGELQAASEFTIDNTVYLSIWRNNAGWLKTAPIVDGTIQWIQSTPWADLSVGELPGTEKIQALGDASTGKILHRSLWRNNEGWYITVPIEEGNLRWSQAKWAGPITPEDVPGEGEVQATSNMTIGTNKQQTIIKNNQRWYRLVPINEDTIEWGAASEWLGPFAVITSLEEDSPVRAVSDIDLP